MLVNRLESYVKNCCNSMKGSKDILAVIESVVHGQLKMDFIILHGCLGGKRHSVNTYFFEIKLKQLVQ